MERENLNERISSFINEVLKRNSTKYYDLATFIETDHLGYRMVEIDRANHWSSIEPYSIIGWVKLLDGDVYVPHNPSPIGSVYDWSIISTEGSLVDYAKNYKLPNRSLNKSSNRPSDRITSDLRHSIRSDKSYNHNKSLTDYKGKSKEYKDCTNLSHKIMIREDNNLRSTKRNREYTQTSVNNVSKKRNIQPNNLRKYEGLITNVPVRVSNFVDNLYRKSKLNIAIYNTETKLKIYSTIYDIERRNPKFLLLGWVTLDKDLNEYYNNVYDANEKFIGELDDLHDGKDYIIKDGSISYNQFVDYE